MLMVAIILYILYINVSIGYGVEPRFPNWGTQSGSGGTQGENVRDNRKGTEFAECTLSNRIETFRRKHHCVHKNHPNSPVFCTARLYLFLINTTTIATMNKHEFKNKSLRKCHACAGLRSGHAPCCTVYGHTHTSNSRSQSPANNVFLVFSNSI